MKEEEKPRGITSFRTVWFDNEAACRELAETLPGSRVCEMKRLFDLPSDWLLMVPK